jgi:hypothetical protein
MKIDLEWDCKLQKLIVEHPVHRWRGNIYIVGGKHIDRSGRYIADPYSTPPIYGTGQPLPDTQNKLDEIISKNDRAKALT